MDDVALCSSLKADPTDIQVGDWRWKTDVGALIIYLHGRRSARSQAVLCVKTFSSLRTLFARRKKPKQNKKNTEQIDWVYEPSGFKTPKISLAVTPGSLIGENSHTSRIILIVMKQHRSPSDPT